MGTILNPDDFPTTLTVSSVSPTVAFSTGGQEITLTGTFKGEAAQVFVVDTEGNDIPCYSGTAGDNYFPCPDNGTTLRAVLPPLDPVDEDYAYSIKVTQGLDSVTLADAISIRRREYRDLVFSTRRLLPRWYKTGVVDEALDEALPILPTPVIPPADGQEFAYRVLGATTFDFAGDNEAIPAPTGSGDLVFGVRDATLQTNWRGRIVTTGAGYAGVDVYAARVPSSGVLVLVYAYSAAHNIVGADNSTLASVVATTGVNSNAIVVGISADGNSLAFGPKIYGWGPSPTPPTTAFLQPQGLSVTDDVILPTLTWCLGSDTADAVAQNEVADFDGEATQAFNDHENLSSGRYASLQVHLRLSATGAYEGHVANANSGTGYFANDAELDYTVAHSTVLNNSGVYPRRSFQTAIARDGSFAVAPSVWQAPNQVGVGFGYGFPRFGFGSSGPFNVELIGDLSNAGYSGGLKFPLTGTTPTPDWFIGNARDYSVAGGSVNDSRTLAPAYCVDDANAVYGIFIHKIPSVDKYTPSFERWPTNYSSREESGWGAVAGQCGVFKVAADGTWDWNKYIQTGDAAPGTDQFFIQPKGCVEVDGNLHTMFSLMETPTAADPFIVDPPGGNWSPSQAHTGINVGALLMVTWNATGGAFVRSRLLTFQRTDVPGTGALMVAPCQLTYSTGSGKLHFGLWLDNPFSSLNPTSFRVDDGNSVTNISGGPSTGAAGQSNECSLWSMSWDPTDGTVAVVRELARSTADQIEELYHFHVGGVR